ncbi:MAG: VOC family protein [Pseudomonadota bacterium]
MAVFDHLAVGAADLTQGAAWARESFGVDVPTGGSHPLMSTHNLLARLSAGYFEIIAVDPGAPSPARPRWYGLDDPEIRASLKVAPQPVAWVVEVSDLDAAMAAASWDPGEALSVTRGDLSWRLTVPKDGSAPERVLPTLIEWPAGPPVDRMSRIGLSLERLILRHPQPSMIRDALASVDALDLAVEVAIEPGSPKLLATLSGPDGSLTV